MKNTLASRTVATSAYDNHFVILCVCGVHVHVAVNNAVVELLFYYMLVKRREI